MRARSKNKEKPLAFLKKRKSISGLSIKRWLLIVNLSLLLLWEIVIYRESRSNILLLDIFHLLLDFILFVLSLRLYNQLRRDRHCYLATLRKHSRKIIVLISLALGLYLLYPVTLIIRVLSGEVVYQSKEMGLSIFSASIVLLLQLSLYLINNSLVANIVTKFIGIELLLDLVSGCLLLIISVVSRFFGTQPLLDGILALFFFVIIFYKTIRLLKEEFAKRQLIPEKLVDAFNEASNFLSEQKIVIHDLTIKHSGFGRHEIELHIRGKNLQALDELLSSSTFLKQDPTYYIDALTKEVADGKNYKELILLCKARNSDHNCILLPIHVISM
jgi:Co/Zn/Cd efflux system component